MTLQNTEKLSDSSNVLRGKRIVVTRARSQASILVERIESLGGTVVEFPTIEIRPPESYVPLDRAIRQIATYDWLIFTSVNGVEQFLNRFERLGKNVADLAGIEIGAIGPETANRLAAARIQPSLVPKQYQAEGILEMLTPETLRGKRVLIPRAAQARDILPVTLRRWGAQVDIVEAYQTVLPQADVSALCSLLREDGIDMITFTSSQHGFELCSLATGSGFIPSALWNRYRLHRSNYKENSGRFRHAAGSCRRRIYDSWFGWRDHRLFFPDRKGKGWRSEVKLEKPMDFPAYRPRRLRRNEKIRALVRETTLSPENLIYPIFVGPGKNKAQPVSSMPGVAQLSVDLAVKECEEVEALDIPAVILFGIPEHKNSAGTEAYADSGIVQQAIRAIKEKAPELLLITDVCLCEYTDHGHCGVIKNGDVDNDSTLELLAKEALSHARAGADIVAPSDMMDGRVGAIRQSLDQNGFEQTAIMAYAAKYASGFYGPFREAAESTPQFGDRRSYQMDPANADEALREVELDIREGADIVMVKPAMAYLDIVYRVKQKFGYPVAAYNVSGEYSMIKAAGQNGWIDEERILLEVLFAIRRAGADMILTYFAKDVARLFAGK